jgi:dihydroorotase
MGRRRTIENDWIVSPCGWTPFAGMKITGWPIATVVRGMVVMEDDEVLGEPPGRLTQFQNGARMPSALARPR